MESIDRQRAALPPIRTFDVDMVKREEADYQNRNTNMLPSTLHSSAAASPTFQPYPSGPPPPYSHPAPVSLHSSAKVFPDIHPSPFTARRTSGGDEHAQQQVKHSLPSIHEALGVEQTSTYPSQPPPPSSNYVAAPQQQLYHIAPATAAPGSPQHRRSFAMDPPSSAPYNQAPQSPYQRYRRNATPTRAQEAVDRRPLYQGNPAPPQIPGRTVQSPVLNATRFQQSSQIHERYPPHTGSMAPPGAPYGYAPYAAAYPAFPPPAAASASIYQPSSMHPAPSHGEPGRISEPTSSALGENSRQYYGESVKRHLDLFDFEAALNEIIECSGSIHEASKQCGVRMHQTQRSGPVPGTLPSIAEIDALMHKSRQTYDALARMRGHVAAQEAAYYQQAQEQHLEALDDSKRNDSVHVATDDSKGDGFAGPEAKKRRGRAAPPGRCHSCNRAETPEWRRGPDGARTLCNACGLHYAKLTRKANGASKASIGSSNLRPKADADESQSHP